MNSTGLPAKVSKELANAAYDDFKRKAIDEAKKRAVAQRVDYDTFKNMVLTAHLKPITAVVKTGNDRPLPCWNFNADGTIAHEASNQPQLLPSGTVSIPSTSGDFYRDWRRNHPTPDDKYRYLKFCGPDTLRSVFRVEVSAEVLRELLTVVEECWLGHGGAAEEGEEGAGAALREAAFVVRVLQALSGAGRFSLTVKLLGNATKSVLQRLFEGLDAAAAAAGAKPTPPAAATVVIEAAACASPGAAAVEAGEAPACSHDGQQPQPGASEGASAAESGMCSRDELDALRRVYGLAC